MERKEAVALLKDIVDSNLASPSLVVLKENEPGKFDLQMKEECNTEALREYITKKKLSIKSDKGYCVIYKERHR